MRNIRRCFIAILLLSCAAGPARAWVNIDIHLGAYPDMVPIPGYPVYYAPEVDRNFFFYDGMYWLYQDDGWYVSDWYNGPWQYVYPDAVPVFILRVPVRYYRRPPLYFRDWRVDAPPRWDYRWGDDWGRRHRGWDQWDYRRPPAPAPLPNYQRNYFGERYPGRGEQRDIRERNYPFQSRDSTQPPRRRVDPPQQNWTSPPQHDAEDRQHAAPAREPMPRRGPPPARNATPAATPHSAPPRQPYSPSRGDDRRGEHGQPERGRGDR